MRIRSMFVFALVTSGSYVFAQSNAPDVINSAGGSHKKGYYIIDWSVGEPALVTTMESPGYIVSNGFLQPFTHDPVIINTNQIFGDEEIRILPNPTYNVLEVDFRTRHQGRVTMMLFDVNGHKLFTKDFRSYGNGYIQKIDMTAYQHGAYFLQINLSPNSGFTKKTGSYKIIKLR
ncbi:T9SS type A sorting domain-containing protein [Flavitalea antarctica]